MLIKLLWWALGRFLYQNLVRSAPAATGVFSPQTVWPHYTAYKSTSQSRRLKGLQVTCTRGTAAFSKLKLSSHCVFVSGFAFKSLSFCNLFFHGAYGMLLQTCGSTWTTWRHGAYEKKTWPRWGALTVRVKARYSFKVVSGAFGIFPKKKMRVKWLLQHVHVHFDCAGSHKTCGSLLGRGIFSVIFRVKWLLWHVHVHFDCAGSRELRVPILGWDICKVLQLIWGLWKWMFGSFEIFYIWWNWIVL